MRMVIAVLIGIVIGFVVFAYTPIGNRYEVKSFFTSTINGQDRLIGQIQGKQRLGLCSHRP